MSTADKAKAAVARIVKECGERVLAQSAVGDGLADVMHSFGRTAECCLEIGTLRGLSSVVLAYFSRSVVTIDVERHPDLEKVLSLLDRDIRDRIATIQVQDNDDKALLISRLNFDFAFIDGGHTEGQVAIDFGLTRRCGELLFHDYPASGSGCNGVDLILKGPMAADGQIELRPPFAWWRAE